MPVHSSVFFSFVGFLFGVLWRLMSLSFSFLTYLRVVLRGNSGMLWKDLGRFQELEKKLQGIKMGDHKLKVNVAKFAVENGSSSGSARVFSGNSSSARVGVRGFPFNFRDSRSFRDVVGKEKGAMDLNKETGGAHQVEVLSGELSVVVPENLVVFEDLKGRAVVARTVDLETLVDLDKLLSIAGTSFTRIQYVGGLSILISFSDESSANSFLRAREVWGPWFSQLVAWNGQPFPFERVAWLRLHGIPMHLLNPEVVRLIGGPFGKVLHVPMGIEDDKDLSIHRMAILTGETKRITEVMALKWCDKTFRVLVEEELDVWVPDCLGGSNSSPSCSSPLQSSPVVGDWVP
ncbi:hypothetical protein HanPI659440_Chr13g0501311 [Helianthus annuus]|nr:hypothetical protein HanPI659440_Chr13g0501311 [Helianthus annuus]